LYYICIELFVKILFKKTRGVYCFKEGEKKNIESCMHTKSQLNCMQFDTQPKSSKKKKREKNPKSSLAQNGWRV